jgi:hypothetical protein
VRLRGSFNLEDVLAAAAAACVLGADFDAVRSAVREFKGVEHRLEYVRDICGVEFYNNSKATSVDATVKSLEAFERGIHLILGGKDKGAPYAPLLPLLKNRVREVLLIGAAADRIAQELSGSVELIRAGNLATAVPEAFQRACPGDVVLLAPACSSFDQFQDYEHRGRVFKELVERLAQDVESGSVKWKWNFREETARQRLEAGRQAQAQSLDGSPQAERQASSKPAPPEASSQPGAETLAQEGDEVLKQAAGLVDEDSQPHVTAASPVKAPPHEPNFVYEVSAGEFPPAEVELAEERPETPQPQASATLEKVDGAPLLYEGRAKETQLKLPQMD